MEALSSADIFLFEGFRLDRRGLFRRDEGAALAPVVIGSRALDVLRVLVERPGDLLLKDEILAAVWPGMAIEENNLTNQMSTLRRILDHGRAEGSCIQTVPRRGYRFIAAVTRRQAGAVSGAAMFSQSGAGPLPVLSIVVLPFTNLGNDPEQEYFVDGITDDLTTDLSRIEGSFVIARSTALTYKGRSVDAKQVGRELGVRYVLEGSVRRTGDPVHVNVQLIDAEAGAHLWADRFETDRANLAEAQDEIAGRLARTLNLELVEAAGRRIEQERAVDPDARDLVMRGWAWTYRPYSVANRQEALRNFERALEIDPGSVDARIGLAAGLVLNLANDWSSPVQLQQDEARAEHLLLEALERDPNSSSVHLSMGLLRRIQSRLAESQMHLETAIALDRNNARAIYQLGHTLTFLGQPEAAIPYFEKAVRLNPRDQNMGSLYLAFGKCHLLLGHLDQAIDFLRKACAGNPRLWFFHLWLAGALGLSGDLDEAKAALAEATKLKPGTNLLAAARALTRGTPNPKYWALRDKTLIVGLRRAGLPDE